jgi:hypothetical protein
VSDPAAIDPAPPGAAPIPVLPLEYAPPPPAASRVWHRILTICLPAAYGCCVLALILIATVTVESVLFTGPTLFAAGLLTVVAGLFARRRVAAVVGACHCAICLLFVGLVNALHWGPRDAQTPFMLMGTVYSIAILFPTYLAWLPSVGRYRRLAP